MSRFSFRLLRGLRDIVYADAARLTYIEDVFRRNLNSYGFEEIRLPVLESAELFDRGLGQATDAVMKEMYEFNDRDGEKVALRPEGTASCVRAVVNNNLTREDRPRFWYAGLMFRHERPQAGRYRQFQQIGAEIFGFDSPDSDVELISLGHAVFRELGVSDAITLEINTIGSSDNRQDYRKALVDYLEPVKEKLHEDDRKRLGTNPLRILDSKDPGAQELLDHAPDLHDFLDRAALDKFHYALAMLDDLDIRYEINKRLVRGFDYYTGIVFEWKTNEIGSQDAVCAGGRYDGLVSLLGGAETGAVGFAAGIERIALLHERVGTKFEYRNSDVYIVPLDESSRSYANRITKLLRAGTDLKVRMHLGGGKMKARMRWADRSGATWAIIVGDDERINGVATVKWLREDRKQTQLPIDELPARLVQLGGT